MTHGHAAKIAEGEGVGPTAKGQQKRSVHEQFFFLTEFLFFVVNSHHVQKAWRTHVPFDSIYTAQGRSDRIALEGGI
jgi:hypothetical protein